MPEAHAEQRDLALAGDADGVHRDAGVVGVARAGRDDDAVQVGRLVGGQRLDPRPVDGVVADDPHVGARGLERLHEVERELVVVVDDEDHAGAPAARRGARRSAAPRRASVAGCDGLLDRAPERRRLVLGLLELLLGHGAGDDSRARVDVRAALAQDRAADRDRRVQVAVVAEVADRAAVQPAPLALPRRRSAASRGPSGAPRQRAGREDGAQRVERVEVRPQPPLDVRHEVQDVAVALDVHVLR